MRSPKLLSLLAAAVLAAFALAEAGAGVLITVDKAAQRMSVKVDGVQRYVWPVSTGKSGYFTPAGSFTPFRLEEDHYSKEWDEAPMPHSIFFTREGHAIHGSFDTKRLGSPASHGCVRLAPQNAATLFALVKSEGLANTKVVLAGQEPPAAPLVAKRNEPRGNTGTASAPLRVSPYYEEPAAPQATRRAEVDDYTTRMRRRYYEERSAYPPSPYGAYPTEERAPRRVYVRPYYGGGYGGMENSW
jgi:L,D-transpeptidase catalytic domain